MSVRLPLLCLLLLLPGCDWTGGPFYAASEAEAPLAPGDYRIDYGGRPGPQLEGLRVTLDPHGLTRFVPLQDGRGEVLAGFTRLGPEPDRYVMWMTKFDSDLPPGTVVYLLLERGGDGIARIYVPNCDSNRGMALSAGAVPSEEGPLAECRFPDRASLEAGLNAFAHHPGESMGLVPIR